MKKKLARNTSNSRFLDRLSKSNEFSIKVAVAENPFTPQHVLGKLAEDKYPGVRIAVARNSNTPWAFVASAISKISRDSYEVPTGRTVSVSALTLYFVSDAYTGDPGEVDVPETDTHWGYVSESLRIAREIFEVHSANRERIMEKLRALNPELHVALQKSET